MKKKKKSILGGKKRKNKCKKKKQKNKERKHAGKAKCFPHTSSSIWKKNPKITILRKKIIKKNHIEKYCSNLKCFFLKNDRAKFSTSSIFEKNKQK